MNWEKTLEKFSKKVTERFSENTYEVDVFRNGISVGISKEPTRKTSARAPGQISLKMSKQIPVKILGNKFREISGRIPFRICEGNPGEILGKIQ